MSDLAAVVNILLNTPAIADVVGQRVWAPEIPRFCLEHPDCREAQHMPRMCVVIKRSGGAATGPGARSYARWRNSRFDFKTYGFDTFEAEMLQDIVYETMTQLGRTLPPKTPAAVTLANATVATGTFIRDAVVTGGPLDGRDPDGDWPYQLTVFDVASSPGS